MSYPRLLAKGPLMLGMPYDPIRNPLIWDLNWPGHPQHRSTITLETFKQLKGDADGSPD